MKPYHVVIDAQGGNTDVSIKNALEQLREFRKLHPPPPPPPKPAPRQKKKR